MGWPGTVALFLAGLLLSGLSGAFAYFLPAVMAAYAQTGQTVSVGSSSGPAAAPPRSGAAFTVLLLGSDDDSKFDADKVLTQSMILVRVEPVSKRVTMLSIPRDLYVPLSTGGTDKIDKAYSYGGAAAAIATVQHSFGIQVDDYVWVGLKGLVHLIDAVGGVDVVTTNPVLDDFYPADLDSSNPYGYKRVAVLPGPQHLSGRLALEYVRSRHGDLQGDFGRSQRQQQVLLALRAKARTMKPSDLPDVATTFRNELKTSMGLDRIRQLMPLAASISDPSQIEQIVLLPPYTSSGQAGGQDVVFPDWRLILPLVHQRFG